MKITITNELIQEFLGPRIFHSSTIIHQQERDLVGFALGLGYNSIGGSVLSLEIAEIPNKNEKEKKGELQMTGSLGDVMKESVEIAYTFAKQFVKSIDSQNEFLELNKLHIHFPEGASRKDGPSAGITITTALISMATGKKYNTDFAMTGEMSLNGNVMKIGGLREKVLAAKREGISNVICPIGNKADVEEMKDYIKEGMNFHFVKTYKEVYEKIFA